MAALTIEKLKSTVGAEITGVDRDRLLEDPAVPGATSSRLSRPTESGVPRTCTSTTPARLRSCKRLGEVEFFPTRDNPEIFRVTLDPKKNPGAEYLRGTLGWHIDGDRRGADHGDDLSADAVAGRAARPSSPAHMPPTIPL